MYSVYKPDFSSQKVIYLKHSVMIQIHCSDISDTIGKIRIAVHKVIFVAGNTQCSNRMTQLSRVVVFSC